MPLIPPALLRAARGLDALAPAVLPLAARLTFAGVLLAYFWNSARTKLGDSVPGILFPSDGAYAQIFPRAFEAVGYDSGQLGVFHWAVATAGLWAEFILPLAILIGLAARLAALGMIGFVVVQSLTDVVGHGLGGDDLGRWFDIASDSLVADQRAFWVLGLLVIVCLGAGPLSVDRLVAGRAAGAAGAAARPA